MRMMSMTVLVAALALLSQPGSAEEHRQLGAHVHGHGRLNIAIEGKKISMELEAPGADIVGFEHEPSTPDQKAAVAEGRAKLADALALFSPSAQAGCELEHVKVSVEAEHENGHGKEPAKEDGEHHHSEFHADYSLQCRSLSRLTSMTFDYFKFFPGAQELDVTVIGPKGQSSFEVTREKPGLDLVGIM
jgi:Protein of unknown function (DUF2796)